MEVGKVNNNPNFGARIIIKKTGFKNLGADIVDSFASGTNTTGTVASSIGEITAIPSEISAGVGFSKSITKGMNRIRNAFNRIFNRNIKTSEFDADSNLLVNSSGNGATGSGLVTTGVGSYGSSIASGLDQSVNYPFAGSEVIPRYLVKSNHPVINEVANNIEGIAFDVLYNKHGIGNETAFIPSGISSGLGASSQGFGVDIIKNASKNISASRNFPS